MFFLIETTTVTYEYIVSQSDSQFQNVILFKFKKLIFPDPCDDLSRARAQQHGRDASARPQGPRPDDQSGRVDWVYGRGGYGSVSVD